MVTGSSLRHRACALAWAALSVIVGHAHAVTQETLTVTSADGTQLPATLLKPDGNGPFPALVMVHDCSGLGPKSSGAPMRWARELAAQGYVAIMPDSFSPRGLPDGVCTLSVAEGNTVGGVKRAADAHAAAVLLRTLPYVDGKHIGLMGGSHGGWTTLAAMSKDSPGGQADGSAKPGDDFAAALALYPACAVRLGSWGVRRKDRTSGPIVGYFGVYEPSAPVLILIGEKDDWTPAEPCERMVEKSRAAGLPVDIKVYSGAYHAFDNNSRVIFNPRRNNANAPGRRGATTGGNPEAWADARREVSAFFARYLKAAR